MNSEGYNQLQGLSQRKVPFSLEAEQSVLGSILIDPRAIEDVAGIISYSDFYLDDHAKIYLAMNELFIGNRTIDLVTLIDMLTKQGVLKDKNISEYIKLIAQIVPSAKNVKDYAQIVKD